MDVPTVESRHVLQTYKRAPVVFGRGEGVYLFDETGRAYLDLISGVGVASLGHANVTLAAALADQAQTQVHTSNLYYHALQGQVASRLASLSGLPRAFFCNSGTEAMEGCLKFARRYWLTAGDRARSGLVALEHARPGDVIANLPYDPRCEIWFDHHSTNRIDKPFKGLFRIAPSAARNVFEYFHGRFKRDFTELVDWTDQIDSAHFTPDEVLHPERYDYGCFP